MNTKPLYPLSSPTARTFASTNFSQNTRQSLPLSPSDVYSAYSFTPKSTDGRDVRIAVIGAFGSDTLDADFSAFGKAFSLPDGTLSVHYPDGRGYEKSPEWSLEATADTQWAYALSPRAEIACVFAVDSRSESLFSAIKYAIKSDFDIISASFGCAEFFGQTELGQILRNSGKIFVASAGDVGGEVLFPSSAESSVSVGGTVIHTTSDGRIFGRSAWANGGGGASRFTKIPEHQRIFGDLCKKSHGFRATPDIALNASPSPGYAVYNSTLGGIVSVGGTSVSAPIFAGLCGVILSRNPGFIGKIDMPKHLYTLAGGTKYDFPQYYFHDIVTGSSGDNVAGVGYDFCTGLGSPRANAVVNAEISQ